MTRKPLYRTKLGKLYNADSLEIMRALGDGTVDLVITSPPYALHFKKEYGNADQHEYVDAFLPFAEQIKRILKPEGSFVLNIGGSWMPGAPVRSLYHYRLLLTLCDQLGFNLAQEFFWYNTAKIPAPAEWVNVRRIRVKDSTEYIFWLSLSQFPKADNRKVLGQYSNAMRQLIKRGLADTKRPSGHVIRGTWASDRGGAIPGNVIRAEQPDSPAHSDMFQCGNNESNSEYIRQSKTLGRKIHPARFPAELPKFFIEFLTDCGDVVMDPFAGSNTTGAVAEELGRRWIAVELDEQYARESQLRFTLRRDSATGSGKSVVQPDLFEMEAKKNGKPESQKTRKPVNQKAKKET